MEYLQYKKMAKLFIFNTTIVLNLVINGIPSILYKKDMESGKGFMF